MKRWFISIYLLMLAGLVVAGIVALTGASSPWSGAGLLLAAGAPLGFFAWLLLAQPPRTEAHPVGVSVIAGLGAVLTMTAVYRYGDVHRWATIGSLAALAGWMAYLRWYSRLAAPSRPPIPGQALPALVFEDLDQRPRTLAEALGAPLVMLFYRGNWCPLCTAQIHELAKHWQALESTGARLWLISSQPEPQTRRIAARFGISAEFLRDPDNRAAKALGIFATGATPAGIELLGYAADAALPTVIVAGPDGRVRRIEVAQNYRIRPDPAEYLRNLD